MAHREQRVEFPTEGGTTLRGTLVLPDGEVRASALFAHCFTCDSRSHAASRISRALADRGCVVLRFDFTGLGESGGDFAETTFTSNVTDLRFAAEYLNLRFGGPQLLIGHSLGGAAVLAAASSIPTAAAIVTIGAPADPDNVLHLFSAIPDVDGDGRVTVDIGGRPFEVGTNLIADLRRQTPAECIAKLGSALLILHSPIDAIVGIDNAREIYDRAKHPKSFVSLDGANHLLSNRADARYVADVVSAWASRYLTGADATAARDDDANTEVWEQLTVVENHPDAFDHTAGIRTHRWLLDEPHDVGGADGGPNPYETLLSALGACTSMTLRMYARRKGWEYGCTRVELAHDRIHAKDCDTCETETGRVDRITRTIHLDPALAHEQRVRLIEIADKCPVHRTLTGEITIQTDAPEP